MKIETEHNIGDEVFLEIDVDEIRTCMLKHAEESIKFYQKEVTKEEEACKAHNDWYDAFIESLD